MVPAESNNREETHEVVAGAADGAGADVAATAVTAATGEPNCAKPWQLLSGLAISGFLLALPGGLLPLWGYHIHPDYGLAGNNFLALALGVIGGGELARRLGRGASLMQLLSAGCFGAGLALLMLSVAAPPAQIWYEWVALLVTGVAAGVVNTAVFEAITPCYEGNPAQVTLLAGIFFGAGSMAAAWMMSESFGESSSFGGLSWTGEWNATRLLAIKALLPAAAAVAYRRLRVAPVAAPEFPVEEGLRDLRSPLAIFFALLLFFQFANEWSIAGWLPVFLIDRLGISPETSVGLLGGYWGALVLGRVVASRLLRVVGHGRMLAVSAFCALFGCAAVLAAGSRFGVVTGLLLTGAGFSAIYPLAAERIASRFSYYHPGYFNGIFTFALVGGMLAPFVLGHLAEAWGLRVVPLAVMVGSCAVFGLVPVIWLGRKVTGR